MLWSLRETLKLIESSAPLSLVSAASFAYAHRIAALLPKATSSCYWECRLTDQARQVDFLTCIAASDGGREILAGRQTDAGLPGFFFETSLWRQAQDFFQQWAEPTSLLYEQAPLIWFEFDHADAFMPEVPLPSFSFCIDPLYAERRSWAQFMNARDPQRRQQVTEDGLQLLCGAPLSSHERKSLLTCFTSLPRGGRIIHVSAMVARQPAVVKLYGSVPREHLFSYLARIGWPGSRQELADVLATFCTPETVDDTMFIDLSIGENVLPRIGIAFAQQQVVNLPEPDPTRRALLDLCVQERLCTPEKREALVSWPGSFCTLFPGEKWPGRFRKWLDVKLVYQPNQLLEAKAYLGFMPYFSLL